MNLPVIRLFPLLFVLALGCGKDPVSPQSRSAGSAQLGRTSILTQREIDSLLQKLACPADKLELPPAPTGGTFHFNILETPNSLDPAWIRDTASSEAATPLHDGLVEFHPITLEVVPLLAKSWEISPDGLAYTFHIREGVFFHDNPCFPGGVGREVTAEDFVYSFQRVCDPRVASPGAWMFLGFVKGAQEYRDGVSARTELDRRAKGNARDETSPDRFRRAEDSRLEELAKASHGVEGLAAPDRRTFVVTLVRPFSPFLYRMGHSFAWPVPREAVEKYGDDFFKNPVGTGPFKFVEWVPAQRIVLEKNPKYWGKDSAGRPLPYLDRIEISQIADANSEHFEFLNGNLHLQYPVPIDQWENIFNEDLSLKPQYSRFQAQSSNFMRIEYVGMLTTDPLFKNVKLRQALNYAVNRDEVASTILRFRATPNNGAVVPPSMPGYPVEEGPYKYDPLKAALLLKEAGYPNGDGLPELTLQLNAMGKENIKIAEVLQGYLSAIGVKVTLQVAEWRMHLDTVRDGKVPFYRMGWLNDYPSPENSMMLLATSGIPPDGENYARYSNPEFDRLYEAALASVDPAEQNRLFREAERVAVEDAAWLFLYFRRDFRLLAPNVRGFPMNGLDRRHMKYVWLAGG
ncbi:MAG: ABC transporter substrate-binding protein [Candidatus Omnitrophica bacterium]|nr:ABC transporter substrate-binding protein [Candidatus Omnitrophota bacterium]